ncbi:MAG: hypothetical protein ACO3XL_02080 [Gemmobacter sp.]
MPTLTVLAPDSSLAMDEIARQLGDNAYILSTTKRDGMVEIKATNDPIPPSPRESKARSAFAAALAEHGATEEVMVLQRPREGHIDPAAREPALAEAAHAEAALAAPRPSATVVRLQQPGTDPQRAGRAPAFRPLAPAPPLPPAAGPAPPPARTGTKRPPEGDEVIRTLGRLHEALSSLRETMLRTDITVPDFERPDFDRPAHPPAAASTARTPDPAQRILAAGFDAALVAEATQDLAGSAAEVEAAFAETLAARIIAPVPEAMLGADAILVLGPSGSGRSTLAAKLGAIVRDLHPDRRCRLVEICPRGMTAPDTLKGFVRMLNSAQMLDIGHAIWHEEELAGLPRPEAGVTHIIDMPSDAATCARILEALGPLIGDDAPRLLAVPAGTTAGMLERQMSRPECAGATVALTKLDECDVAAAELSGLAAHDLRIGWLSGTRALVGNLSPATGQVMRDYVAGYIAQA